MRPTMACDQRNLALSANLTAISIEMHHKGITTTNEDEKKSNLNPSDTEFCPKWSAAEIAKSWLKDFEEDDDGFW